MAVMIQICPILQVEALLSSLFETKQNKQQDHYNPALSPFLSTPCLSLLTLSLISDNPLSMAGFKAVGKSTNHSQYLCLLK